ncbi:hypothetical protein Tco_0976390 [Tanacetum coccineum]|uniref:Transposase n=1 Tax=Tanacetum coccineum TaxID=301880 RepID=A0ABQ5EH34_9ASTR
MPDQRSTTAENTTYNPPPPALNHHKDENYTLKAPSSFLNSPEFDAFVIDKVLGVSKLAIASIELWDEFAQRGRVAYTKQRVAHQRLNRTDFESWQQRIRLYCLGKDNGENIMKSINEGPFHMGTVSDVIVGGTAGAVQQGPVRARALNDLSAEEKERYKANIRATNILL